MVSWVTRILAPYLGSIFPLSKDSEVEPKSGILVGLFGLFVNGLSIMDHPTARKSAITMSVNVQCLLSKSNSTLNDLNDSQSWDLIWLDAIFTISPRWGIIRKDKHIQPEIWRSKIFRDIPGPLTMALIHVRSVQAWICCVIEIYPDVEEWCFCKDVGDKESFVCFSLWSFLFCCRTKMNFFPIGHWVFDFEIQNQVIPGHLWPQDGPILHLITGHPI